MAERSLRAPASVFAASYLEALREGYQFGSDLPLRQEAMDAIASDFPSHLAAITRQGGRRVFPDGSPVLSPFSLFWLIEDQAKFLGALLMRHELANEHARLFGGHIRYGVRPSRRNEGIGTELLMAGLAEARGFGLGRVLVTCGEVNLSSRRLIEKCGGEFEKTVHGPRDVGLIRRYWIML